jgi:cell division protein FtsI/penicillin-binding protein 2
MRKSRVLVAAAGLLFGLAALWLRVGWLQIAEHGFYSARAERNHQLRVLVRPERGDLLDRHGRPLAHDLQTYTLTAAPRELANPRATARELARRLQLPAAKLERELTSGKSYRVLARQIPPEVGQGIADWNRRGLYLSLETRRECPLGTAASEVLGHTDTDAIGVDGLELQLDETLRGRSGWTTLFRDGRGRSIALPRGLRRRPQDGEDVVLSLDADLQAIVEHHLARAVDTLKAERGFAIFLDPNTGEILAAANAPHVASGRGRNWTMTDQFEPGSTFKIVVAGAALEEKLARPNEWFEASPTGVALLAPGALFHDVHKEPSYTFRDAVRWSSNIVMGRLGLRVGSQRLYRYATDLGFGELTGVSFPGEASGRLRSPAAWSARSCPTIAIGHELSVTPLQLALAYGAIANGGVLMEPMLVREVRDRQGRVVRQPQPRAVRRVFSEATTATLREMLCAVVDSGTAKAARVPGLAIGGKTGTAQKYDARVGTYGRGMYLSSFAGFAPAQAPRVVGVVVIDEPHGKHYYGGEVAAPVFREVLLDLMRLPEGPFEARATEIAARPPAPAPVTVPDLRLLPPAAAERRLAEFGLRARFQGSGPRVLAQSPVAGLTVERGTGIEAWLAPPSDSLAQVMPDLAGNAMRDALRRLALLGLRTRIHGRGLVVRQEPLAGAPLPADRVARLWCQPGVALPSASAPGAIPALAAATDRAVVPGGHSAP